MNSTGLVFLQELGHRKADATGDPRETTSLFPYVRIVCTRRVIAVAFRAALWVREP